MVTRRQKLLAAVVVLALGFGLAWPLRRTEPLRPASAPTAVEALSQPVVLDEPLSPQSPVQAALGVGGSASGPRDPFAQDADGASPPFSQVSDPAPLPWRRALRG